MEYWQEVSCDDTKWESHVEEELKPAKTSGWSMVMETDSTNVIVTASKTS